MPSEARRREREQRNRKRSIKQIVELKEHIRLHLGCANCGAPPGEHCLHDYGCVDVDRSVR